MKRLMSSLAVVGLVLGLAGCKGDQDTSSADQGGDRTETASESSPQTEASAEPSEASEPSESASENSAPNGAADETSESQSGDDDEGGAVVNLDSPREAVESMHRAAQNEDWEALKRLFVAEAQTSDTIGGKGKDAVIQKLKTMAENGTIVGVEDEGGDTATVVVDMKMRGQKRQVPVGVEKTDKGWQLSDPVTKRPPRQEVDVPEGTKPPANPEEKSDF